MSGEKGLEGLGARAHRGWASPLGEHVGPEEASGRHPRVLPSRGDASGPGNTPGLKNVLPWRLAEGHRPQRTGS